MTQNKNTSETEKEEVVERFQELAKQRVERGKIVIRNNISQLQDRGVLPNEEVTVQIQQQIRCSHCGTVYTVSEYCDQAGCSCDDTREIR